MAANSTEYNKKYWAQYKQKKHRVSGVLPLVDFIALEKRAAMAGRKPFQQLWLESDAYRRQQYAPSKKLEALNHLLVMEIRKIGNNINQQAKHVNSFRRIVAQRQVFTQLKDLETLVKDFILYPPNLDK